jgi:enoyl-CoA hydratase
VFAKSVKEGVYILLIWRVLKMDSNSEVRLEYDHSHLIATLVISHPRKLNAINLKMWRQLDELLAKLSEKEEVRVLIIRGEGEEAFSAGADISEFSYLRRNTTQAVEYQKILGSVFNRLLTFKKPTISMIQGVCAGGGCYIAIASDIRIATATGRIGIPVSRIGFVMGYSELQRLLEVVGVSVATYMLLTGRFLHAEEALRLGLISKVVPAEEIEQATLATAELIVDGAPLVHTHHKKMMKILQEKSSLSELSQEEINLQYACFETKDYQEGYRAFQAKKKATFTGK